MTLVGEYSGVQWAGLYLDTDRWRLPGHFTSLHTEKTHGINIAAAADDDDDDGAAPGGGMARQLCYECKVQSISVSGSHLMLRLRQKSKISFISSSLCDGFCSQTQLCFVSCDAALCRFSRCMHCILHFIYGSTYFLPMQFILISFNSPKIRVDIRLTFSLWKRKN